MDIEDDISFFLGGGEKNAKFLSGCAIFFQEKNNIKTSSKINQYVRIFFLYSFPFQKICSLRDGRWGFYLPWASVTSPSTHPAPGKLEIVF